MKYRHLFFDLDNTLYDFDTNAYHAMFEAFTQLGIISELPSFDAFFKVYSGINDELWALYRENKIIKEVLRGLRFERSLGAFGIKPNIPYTSIDDLYLKKMTQQTALFPETISILSELKKRGYQLHIITNGFKEVQSDKLRNTGLGMLIKNVFISEIIKSPKPQREIFEHSIKSSNARKKESLMIGDSWESDIVGAKNFGIDQVFFNPSQQEIDMAELGEPTFTITCLSQLLEILP
ncbi:MAG TPA: YjjG family noncanonical pyrimidine nucleotidase [Prolixibacteraceae bacterium]|nr:YjjG family noncanonical pyrimidine nucleotidase [Prolixibacteraceae bacterium]